VWSEKKLSTTEIAKKLVALGKQLNQIGVGTSPILN
jgi:hypothetical protein